MRNIMMLLLVAATAGCAVSSKTVMPAASETKSAPACLGMSREVVSAAMAEPVMVGVEVDPDTGKTTPIKVKSLYSTEIVTTSKGMYTVDFYITESPRAGRPVSEDLLTPMIFKDGVLVGNSRSDLDAVRAGQK